MLWVGAGLAVVAAVLLAFVPRLPSSGGAQGFLAGQRRRSRHRHRQSEVEGLRGGSDRRFVRAGGGGRLIREDTPGAGGRTNAVRYAPRAGGGRARDANGKTPSQVVDYYREATRRIRELPGVQNVAVGTDVPWRADANFLPPIGG